VIYDVLLNRNQNLIEIFLAIRLLFGYFSFYSQSFREVNRCICWSLKMSLRCR
jgi:hypothetical protein